jgi:uncharacterized membrane protein
MSDNETRLKQAERFATIRRVLLVINALAYIVWIGAQSLYFIEGINAANQLIARIQMVAGPVWLISLLALFFMIFRLFWRRDLRAMVDDERTQTTTHHAFLAGYIVLLVSVVIFYTLSLTGHRPNLSAVLPIMLSLGVAVPSLTYAALYRG